MAAGWLAWEMCVADSRRVGLAHGKMICLWQMARVRRGFLRWQGCTLQVRGLRHSGSRVSVRRRNALVAQAWILWVTYRSFRLEARALQRRLGARFDRIQRKWWHSCLSCLMSEWRMVALAQEEEEGERGGGAGGGESQFHLHGKGFHVTFTEGICMSFPPGRPPLPLSSPSPLLLPSDLMHSFSVFSCLFPPGRVFQGLLSTADVRLSSEAALVAHLGALLPEMARFCLRLNPAAR